MSIALNHIVPFAAGVLALTDYPELGAEERRLAEFGVYVGLTELHDGDAEAVIRRTETIKAALQSGRFESVTTGLADAVIMITLVAANRPNDAEKSLPRLRDVVLGLLQRESGLDDDAFADLFAAQGLELRVERVH
jgi:hypothetical protein